MKTLLLLLLFPIFSFSQIQLTKDYEVYEVFSEPNLKSRPYYTWVFTGDSYVMFFPISVTGLENLRDKIEYIASQSGIDDQHWNKSRFPDEISDEEDLHKILPYITNGNAIISFGYNIENKRLSAYCSDKEFSIMIK